LRTIDQLWVKYSNGRFGFSVQKRIYQSLGGTRQYDEKVWEKFGDKVGWRKNNSWLYYNVLTFSEKAPEAHLPWVGGWGDWGGWFSVWVFVGLWGFLGWLHWGWGDWGGWLFWVFWLLFCFVLGLFLSFLNVVRWRCEVGCGLFSRVETCKV